MSNQEGPRKGAFDDPEITPIGGDDQVITASSRLPGIFPVKVYRRFDTDFLYL